MHSAATIREITCIDAGHVRCRLYSGLMLHFFKAAPDQVGWGFTSVENRGSHRLAVSHAHGAIGKYFTTAALASLGMRELAGLLRRASGLEAGARAGLPS